jgi:predicted enzyme related to lactoylglutathione lyase
MVGPQQNYKYGIDRNGRKFMNIRYAHTNINAKDWRRLVAFYSDVFGCVPIGPEKHLRGEWLERVSGVPKATIDGQHMKLPGYDENGPILEIFTYNHPDGERPPYINGYGFAHIAFEVEDVDIVFERFVKAGGSSYGEKVRTYYTEIDKTLDVVYAKDPEGNGVEIMKWSLGRK